MTTFMLDLLHDLRENRLAPVAIGLLVAVVAVPLVLMKSGGAASDAGTAPPVADASATTKPSVVRAVQDGPGGGSDLDVFDPKDPFKSGAKAQTGQAANDVPGTVSPPLSSGGGSSGTSGLPSQASPGPSPLSGNGAPPASVGPPAIGPRVRKSYTYVVDVAFGQTGDERSRRGVSRLGILPNDRNPVAVFLGVTADATRAVFLVNARVSQAGEGRCRPSVKGCTFLYLRDAKNRNEQFLSDANGHQYHLTLLGIRRVEVKKPAKNARTSRRRMSTHGAKARAVELPVLAPDIER